MRLYRFVWLAVTGPIVAAGLLVVLFLDPVQLLTFGLTYLIALVAYLSVRLALHPAHHGGPHARSSWARRAQLAAGGALACAAALGLAVALGPPAVALLLLLAVGSPPVLARYRPPSAPRRASASATPLAAPTPGGEPSATRNDAVPAGDGLAATSTRQLCRDWRCSWTALQRSGDPAEIARVVDIRRRYLDEMERRDAAGFRRWINSGARAAGDPGTYLLVATEHDRPAKP